MLFDMIKVTGRQSDMHGAPCPFCQDRPCVTTIYLVDVDGGGDTAHTCENMICIGKALDPSDMGGHHSDAVLPIVEVFDAPMPWLTGVPAPLAPVDVDQAIADAAATGDLDEVAHLVRTGRVA